jgi:syntaxin 1B/2/3
MSSLPPQGNTLTNAPMEADGAHPLSREDFLVRIEGVKQRIGLLTSDISAIATVHQRMLSSPDNRSTAELESIVTNTQIRNTQIKDEIKFLERDAVRDSNTRIKRTQIEALKTQFKMQLEQFQKEEADYSKKYREAVGRQYRIINPDATDAEVDEIANSDLGAQGIFTQAVSLNILKTPTQHITSFELMLTLHSSNPTAAAKPPAFSAPSAPATTTSSASKRPWAS